MSKKNYIVITKKRIFRVAAPNFGQLRAALDEVGIKPLKFTPPNGKEREAIYEVDSQGNQVARGNRRNPGPYTTAVGSAFQDAGW